MGTRLGGGSGGRDAASAERIETLGKMGKNWRQGQCKYGIDIVREQEEKWRETLPIKPWESERKSGIAERRREIQAE